MYTGIYGGGRGGPGGSLGQSGRPCGVTCGGQTGQAGDFAIQGYSSFVSYIDEGGELLGTTD